MYNKTINKINEQGKDFQKFSNEWNVMQQLIDILTVQKTSAEIVYQDLDIKEMQLTALVDKVVKKRLSDPYKVMEEICKFYSIPVPEELPPEVWRNASNPASKNEPINLLDLI